MSKLIRAMDRTKIKKLVSSAVISEPCGVDWESMTGDERVRLCSQCNLKVHNLSVMSEREAAQVLERRKFERTCIRLTRRKDGSVKVDNCPRALRKTRDRLITVASFVLVCLSLGLWHGALAAGGLTGAGVSYGPPDEVIVADSDPLTNARNAAINAAPYAAAALVLFKLRSKSLSLWMAACFLVVIMFGAGVAWALGLHV